MSRTASRPVNTMPAGFTKAELTHLMVWADQHGLDVALKPAVSDVAHDAAVVRCEGTVASWAISRANGHLWLDFTADWLRQGFRGWGVKVGSVEEAATRITFNIERRRDAGLGRHNA